MKFVPILLALVFLTGLQASSDDTASHHVLINETESTSTVPIDKSTHIKDRADEETTQTSESTTLLAQQTSGIDTTTTVNDISTSIQDIMTTSHVIDNTTTTEAITQSTLITTTSIDSTTVSVLSSESSETVHESTTLSTLTTLPNLVATTKSVRYNLQAAGLNESSNATDLLEIYFTNLSTPEPPEIDVESLNNKKPHDYRVFYIIICFLFMLIAIPVCILLFITFVLLLFDYMTCRGENICLVPYNRLTRGRRCRQHRASLRDVRSRSFEKIELKSQDPEENRRSSSSYKICNTVRITSFYGDEAASLKPYHSGFFYETESMLGNNTMANELNQAEQHLSKSITELDELLNKQRSNYYRSRTNLSVFTQKRDTLNKQSQLEKTELLLDELINELGDEVDGKKQADNKRNNNNGLLKVVVTDANGNSSVQSDDE